MLMWREKLLLNIVTILPSKFFILQRNGYYITTRADNMADVQSPTLSSRGPMGARGMT